MKTTLTLIALGLAGTLAIQAQEPQRERRGPGGNRPTPPEVLKEFDKNGDGTLNDEEAKAAREAMQARRAEAQKKRLEKYDTDKDGKLNEEEQSKLNADVRAQRQALVKKYDANDNNRLDPDELQAARDAGEEIPLMGGGMGRRGQGGPGGQGRPQRGEGRQRPAPPAGE